MATVSRDPHALVTYGMDAPGVLRGFFVIGAATGVVGAILLAGVAGALALLGWLLILIALAALALGVSMLLYSSVGKLRLRDHLLRQHLWRGDEVVLDIGAGRGLMSLAAAHRSPTGRVMALDLWSARDLSGNSAEALRANAALEGIGERLEVVTGDARRLELADASVDVVASVFCLHNIEPQGERAAACREIVRVLKPGGCALIADFPGVGGYPAAFEGAGLTVEGPFRAERIALGIAGYLIARKPLG